MIHFEIPKNQSSILKVIGVGGGGGNAVNYMYNLDLEGVDFVVCNTDQQALAQSPVPNKIQLGPHLTQGLGAGANPEIGKQASEESVEDISKILKVNTRMAFITCGMGGGTGTGGAPVVAKICRELGILTVGIVTLPFSYEGRKRMKQAQEGIDRMREHVDTILVISNDKLRQQFGNLPFTQAFAKADNVLATAAKCITDVITTSGQVNVDFADVTTVMKNGGVAILGNAAISGENRALRAVEEALNSPLLNDNDIRGAKWILLNVTSAPGEFEHTLDELDEVQAYVQQMAGDNCDLIMGVGHDPAQEDRIGVTVIATGFNHKEIKDIPAKAAEQPARISLSLDGKPATPPAQPAADAMMPKLVDNTPTSASNFSNLRPLPASEEKPQERFTLKIDDQTTQNTFAVEEEGPFQLVIKEDLKPASQYDSFTIGEHRLSAEELEERRVFEEQKRQLEERAERLRKLSFNIKGGDADDIENVPAYMRRNVNVNNNSGSSKDTYYSGYSVGVNDSLNNQGAIQTINTFLDGKKPD
jgi:cell division protein FtsZ